MLKLKRRRITVAERGFLSEFLDSYNHLFSRLFKISNSKRSDPFKILLLFITVSLFKLLYFNTIRYIYFNFRRETTPSSELEAEPEAEAGEESDDLDSTTKPSSEANTSRSRSTVEKMPTESEIEDFFAAAETKLVKQFSDKYTKHKLFFILFFYFSPVMHIVT